MREEGFTLVELLVALLIFAMLSAAGVALLSQSARTGEAVERRLDRMADLRRARALLSADLAQAAPRPHRDEGGAALPAFRGNSSFLSLVRRGRETEETARHPSLARIDYHIADGALIRTAYPMVDGSEPRGAARLIDGIVRHALRYRDRRGGWRTRWDPARADELPVAVELVIEREAGGAIRQLFLIGAA